MDFQSKLPDLEVTIFSKMSAMAQQHGALNLSQGFPDFDPHPDLLDRVSYYLNRSCNQYAPMPGLPELRQQLAMKMQDLYNASVGPDQITVTAGATQAIFSAIQALVHSGDEVIVFDPAYDCYEPAIKLVGAKAVHLPLLAPDFGIPWEDFGKSLNSKTKLVIINTPHNPTGAVWSDDDMAQLENYLADTDVMVLSDEVYEHIIFDQKHHSILSRPALADRSLAVFSFGKTYHCTGWKLGYIAGSGRLMQEFRKVHQYEVFCVNHPLQRAIADFLDNKEAYLGLGEFYKQKRDLFLKLIENSRFSFVPTAGTYFQLLDYSAISEAEDVLVSEQLCKEAGIASIPISVFYEDKPEQHMLRFCFAKSDEMLEGAAEIINQL